MHQAKSAERNVFSWREALRDALTVELVEQLSGGSAGAALAPAEIATLTEKVLKQAAAEQMLYQIPEHRQLPDNVDACHRLIHMLFDLYENAQAKAEKTFPLYTAARKCLFTIAQDLHVSARSNDRMRTPKEYAYQALGGGYREDGSRNSRLHELMVPDDKKDCRAMAEWLLREEDRFRTDR